MAAKCHDGTGFIGSGKVIVVALVLFQDKILENDGFKDGVPFVSSVLHKDYSLLLNCNNIAECGVAVKHFKLESFSSSKTIVDKIGAVGILEFPLKRIFWSSHSNDDSPFSASYPVPLKSATTSVVACSHSSVSSVLFSSSGQPFQVQSKAICKEPMPIVQQKPS